MTRIPSAHHVSLVAGIFLAMVVGLALAPHVAADVPDNAIMAGAQPTQSCDLAAMAAARDTGVPLDILRAISRVETGRSRAGVLEPWPWTLNAGGDGHWFDTADAALAHLRRHLATGRRNVDVGCFQLNHRWHADAFQSLEAMIDPVANARYAADFLARLHAELGTWEESIAAYHSRTPSYADRYLSRYRTVHATLPELGPAATAGTRQAPARSGPRAPAPLMLAARPPLFGATPGAAWLSARPPLARSSVGRPLFGDGR